MRIALEPEQVAINWRMWHNRIEHASVLPPAEGSWATVYWSIQNGYFTDSMGQQTTGAYGTAVMFVANDSGPVTLSVGAVLSTMKPEAPEVPLVPEVDYGVWDYLQHNS